LPHLHVAPFWGPENGPQKRVTNLCNLLSRWQTTNRQINTTNPCKTDHPSSQRDQGKRACKTHKTNSQATRKQNDTSPNTKNAKQEVHSRIPEATWLVPLTATAFTQIERNKHSKLAHTSHTPPHKRRTVSRILLSHLKAKQWALNWLRGKDQRWQKESPRKHHHLKRRCPQLALLPVPNFGSGIRPQTEGQHLQTQL
jgi:hypothetical protein